MNTMITSFNYKAEMTLLTPTKEYPISADSITNIAINNDYDKNTMPIVYVGLDVESSLYKQLVLNASKAFISFRLYKYDTKSTSAVDKKYIDDKFIYIMTDNPNYNESIISATSDIDTELVGYIALISLSSINNNKRLFNTIVKNTNLASIVHEHTKHMPMCIEPFDYNPVIDQFIIPPITSVKDLLQYLNSNYCFYKSGYRYYRDFDVTYLLSMRGISVPTNNTNYNTVIISIKEPLDPSGNSNGTELNREAKAYIINITANNTSISIDRLTDKTFNSIMAVDLEGNSEQIVLDIPSNPESTEKVLLGRVNGNNLTEIYNIKQNIESSSTVLSVSKTEIDSTILTPNKEFFIRNYASNNKYDGRYILSYKKEILVRQDTRFIGNVIFGLRKVNESE